MIVLSPTKSVVQWDGKLLPDMLGKKTLVDRLSLLLSSFANCQYLGQNFSNFLCISGKLSSLNYFDNFSLKKKKKKKKKKKRNKIFFQKKQKFNLQIIVSISHIAPKF